MALVALDRDGTVLEYVPYLDHPGSVSLIPGAAEAIRLLNERDIPVVLVTNQSIVGRGWLSLAQLDRIHDRMMELLAFGGAHLDAIYVCPHVPDDGCHCRKPSTGLIESACRDYRVLPEDSWVIGDHATDMLMACAVGARGIRVKTGVQLDMRQDDRWEQAPDLGSAIYRVLEDLRDR